MIAGLHDWAAAMSNQNPAPEDLGAREAAAIARYQAGDMAGAAVAFRELLASQPKHANALQFLAFEAGQRGDFAAAAEYYARAAAVEPEDPVTRFNLAMAHMGLQQWPQALTALDETLEREPRMVEAMLYRGSAFERMQRPDDAALAYLRATRFAEANLDPRRMPPELKQFLNHALGVVRDDLDRQIDGALAELTACHGAESVARIRKGADIFTGKRPREFAHPKWRPGLFYVPDLPPQAFYEREDFAWTERVEAATDMVRAEMLNVLSDGRGFAPYVNHPEGSHAAEVWKGINQSHDWSTFHFFRHGERIEENCARCPGTAALLDSLDLMRVPGYGPEVMFSVLKPHSRIPPHYGTVNGRLIVHLPLVVPPDCGALKAAGEARAWQEGRLMMFDDSFEHEAWNDSDQTRVVLIFDTWNPHLSEIEREAFRRVLGTAQRFERAA